MAVHRVPYRWGALFSDWQSRPRNTYERIFPVLRQVYLEDSWVLSVRASPDSLVFDLDAVVTEAFPDYRGPRPGEYYDYRRAQITVAGSQVVYEPSNAPPSQDLDGTLVYGNIDSWLVRPDGWSRLEGSWGRARVLGAELVLRFLDER